MNNGFDLERTTKGDTRVRRWMAAHYSAPRGFVGRQIVYLVTWCGIPYGAIAAGSATRHLPGRNAFFPGAGLQNIVANTFFHVEGPYPFRNFTTYTVARWRERVVVDWLLTYGSVVAGFETLVELPRTGELYRRDGWIEVAQTKGFTCKRPGGKGTDAWTGRREWNTTDLRPKRVFCRKC